MKYALDHQEWFALGVNLWRIRALRDIARHGVKAGDLGGYIGGYRNLSQENDAWVGSGAVVNMGAQVFDNALVRGLDTASGMQEAFVQIQAQVYGNSVVAGSIVRGKARIYDRAHVSGGQVDGNARVFGNARVTNTLVYGNARIFGNAQSNPLGCLEAVIKGHAWVFGNAVVRRYVSGYARVFGDAVIEMPVYFTGTAHEGEMKHLKQYNYCTVCKVAHEEASNHCYLSFLSRAIHHS